MDAGLPTVRLADLFAAGHDELIQHHGSRLDAHHHHAIRAIRSCRTTRLGQMTWGCSNCTERVQTPRSCGHRSCPRCQNHSTTEWLERQRQQLLPVDYYMLTFTLPDGLRGLARAQPRTVYNALFAAASTTLKGFAERKFKAELGQCAVLHTHSRRLDLHPHVHIVVPGGGLQARRRQWCKIKSRYLFNAFALARVFRAKMLRALSDAGLALPVGLPPKWVVDCRCVGNGEPALQYLSRYLYRGVIREDDLVRFDEEQRLITFRYRDAQTRTTAYRTLPLVDFLWRLLQHVLPSGLCRVRHYGFLHGKARQRLLQVQLLLRVIIAIRSANARPTLCCPCCHSPMPVIAVTQPRPTPRPDG